MVGKKELTILKALAEVPQSFSELLVETGLTRPTLSTHLKKLEEKNLVEPFLYKRDKRRVFYRLNERELIITTMNDVLRYIQRELGRELSKEERETLKEIFLQNFRPVLIDHLKNHRLRGDILDVISLIDSVALLQYTTTESPIKDLLQMAAPSMHGSDYAELSKTVFPNCKFMPFLCSIGQITPRFYKRMDRN